MSGVLHVQPARERRVAFARWGCAQTPKIRTTGPQTFAVDADAFVTAPEHVLIGALVNGHRYLSPEEDRAAGKTPPKGPSAPTPNVVLVGEAGPEAKIPQTSPTRPGHAPPLKESGLDEHPTTENKGAPADDSDLYTCDLCDRDFRSARGRDTHHRRAHGG